MQNTKGRKVWQSCFLHVIHLRLMHDCTILVSHIKRNYCKRSLIRNLLVDLKASKLLQTGHSSLLLSILREIILVFGPQNECLCMLRRGVHL